MSPLVILPLLAAACLAAPQNLIQTGAFPGQIQFASVAAPAVATVQVPLTRTVHYETKPVVTGFQTSIIKPAIATGFAAAPFLPAVAPQQVQQVIVPGNSFRQLELPPFPNFPAFPPSPNGTAPGADAPPAFPAFPDLPILIPSPNPNGTAPGGDAPQFPIMIPGFPTLTQPEKSDLLQTQSNPLISPIEQNPVQIVQTQQVQDDAVVVEARAVPTPIQAPSPIQVQAVQPILAIRAAQAGDYEPLVTKEKVLAPVRTNTVITPQVTRVEPEVTVRRVIQDVPVATPVAVHTPVQYRVANPIVQGQAFLQPNGFVGQQFFGGPQVLSNGQVFSSGVVV